jgi:hypothetical protein
MFTYEGALFWKMRLGMGDAVFAPLFEACRAQGVRFELFDRVDRIAPTEDGREVGKVTLTRQVRRGAYEPLIDVSGVPSWPSEPRWEQLDAPAAVRERPWGLEDPRVPLPDAGQRDLVAGRDFDAVVLAIPTGALREIAAPLAAVHPAWADMLERLPAIATGALQLWARGSGAGLAGRFGNVTGSAYAAPLTSWSDMSPSIAFEARDDGAGTVIYACGPVEDDATIGTVEAWGAANADRVVGSDVLDRYARINAAPSDRYVLDLPGTNRYRLEADTSGFSNLYLAGDWLFTGLGGSVESAVIAGMQAARALGGGPGRIVGEIRSPWRPA